jgi:hypothetical protein
MTELTSCITFNSPPTEEVLRLDKEGFHYRGQFIADAGEAHRLMVEFLKQSTKPEPQMPTDDEIEGWHTRCADAGHYWAFDVLYSDVTSIVRAALAHWGCR